MSYFDYRASQEIDGHDYPFYAIIMAAMRKADTSNVEKLKSAFPATFLELQERYNLPLGMYQNEVIDGKTRKQHISELTHE